MWAYNIVYRSVDRVPSNQFTLPTPTTPCTPVPPGPAPRARQLQSYSGSTASYQFSPKSGFFLATFNVTAIYKVCLCQWQTPSGRPTFFNYDVVTQRMNKTFSFDSDERTTPDGLITCSLTCITSLAHLYCCLHTWITLEFQVNNGTQSTSVFEWNWNRELMSSKLNFKSGQWLKWRHCQGTGDYSERLMHCRHI